MADKSFKTEGGVFDIPESEAQAFLKDNPHALEVQSFVAGKDTFDIPLKDVGDFVKEMPQAKPLKKKEESQDSSEIPTVTLSASELETPSTPKPKSFEQAAVEKLLAGRTPEEFLKEAHDKNLPIMMPQKTLNAMLSQQFGEGDIGKLVNKENPNAQGNFQSYTAQLHKQGFTQEQIDDGVVANKELLRNINPDLVLTEGQRKNSFAKDNGLSRLASGAATADQVLYGLPGDVLQSIGILESKISSVGSDVSVDADQNIFKKWGNQYKDFLEKKVFPSNPKYANEWWASEFPHISASLLTFMAGGELAKAGKLAMGETEGAALTKKLFTGTAENPSAAKLVKAEMEKHAPMATMAGMQSGVGGFNQAKQITDAANKLPFDEFFQQVYGGDPDKQKIAFDQYADLHGKNPDEVGFDNFKYGFLSGAPFMVSSAAALEKLNQTTGNAFIDALNHSVSPSLDGAVQMATSTAISNLGAQASYDKVRDIWEGVKEQFAGGAIIGGLLPFAAGIKNAIHQKIAESNSAAQKKILQAAEDDIVNQGLTDLGAFEAMDNAKKVEVPATKSTITSTVPPEPAPAEQAQPEAVAPIPTPEPPAAEPEVKELTPKTNLKSVELGRDVIYNGQIGKIDRSDSGEWEFIDENGKAKVIPVEDKTNAVESLESLGIEPLHEISKEDISQALKDKEQVGETEYKGKKYFVSIANPKNENTVGDKVGEITADGRIIERFGADHPDQRFAADKKLAIINTYLAEQGLPKRNKIIESGKVESAPVEKIEASEKPVVSSQEPVAKTEEVKPVASSVDVKEEDGALHIKSMAGDSPNEHGVYGKREEFVLGPTKKGYAINDAEINFVQLENGKWISTRRYNTSDSGGGSPLMALKDNQFDSKEEAIADAANDIIKAVSKPGDTEVEKKIRKRIHDWAKQYTADNKETVPEEKDAAPVEEIAAVKKRIEKLNTYESDGYNVVRLRLLKQSMQDNLEKAKLAFEIHDYAVKDWDSKLQKFAETNPLASVSQFYHGDYKSLSDYIEQQIQGEQDGIQSNEKYIAGLGKSKSDRASAKMFEDTVDKAKQRIEKYRTDLKKQKPETQPVVIQTTADEAATPIGDAYRNKLLQLKHKPETTTDNIEVGDFIRVAGTEKKSGIEGFVKSVARKNIKIETTYGGWGDSDVTMQEHTIAKSEVTALHKIAKIESESVGANKKRLENEIRSKLSDKELTERIEFHKGEAAAETASAQTAGEGSAEAARHTAKSEEHYQKIQNLSAEAARRVEKKPVEKTTPHTEVKTDINTVTQELGLSHADAILYNAVKDATTDGEKIKSVEQAITAQEKIIDEKEKKIELLEYDIDEAHQEHDDVVTNEDMSGKARKAKVAELTKKIKELSGEQENLKKELVQDEEVRVDLENTLSDMNDGEFEDTQFVINRINARLETRYAVRSGTDLFPEDANIPEYSGNTGESDGYTDTPTGDQADYTSPRGTDEFIVGKDDATGKWYVKKGDRVISEHDTKEIAERVAFGLPEAKNAPHPEKPGEEIHPIEIPELVQLVKELTGELPNVKRMRMRGVFSSGDESVSVNRTNFDNESEAARTLAHEIGHLADYFPDKRLDRGNLVGRIFSLNNFVKDTFGIDSTPLTEKERRKFASETESAYRKELGIKGKDKFTDVQKAEYKKRFDDRITAESNLRGLVRDAVVKKELTAVSEYMRPYDKESSSANHIKYRNSAVEIYADALSMLFRDPGRLQEMAPVFFEKFFENLDRKPEVREEYFKIQDMLNNGDEVNEERWKNVLASFEKGKQARANIANVDEVKKSLRERIRSRWEKIQRDIITLKAPLLNKLQDPKTLGVTLSESQHMRNLLEALSAHESDIWLLNDKIDNEVIKPLEMAGLGIDDLGVIGMIERNMAGRETLANPLGIQSSAAKAMMEHAMKKYGADQFDVLMEAKKKFHALVYDVYKQAHENGMFTQEQWDNIIEKNKETYMTYQMVEYIDKNYVSGKIIQATGTFKEAENPVVSTILKTISIIKATNRQKAINQFDEIWQRDFPGEIHPSAEQRTRSGDFNGFKDRDGHGRIEYYKDGKWVGLDVDPAIAHIFKAYEPEHIGELMKALSWANRHFKPLVTTYNLGFAYYSNIMRDNPRAFKNIMTILMSNPGTRNLKNALTYIPEYLTAYVKSLKHSAKFSKGKLTDLTKEMLEHKALSATSFYFNDYDPNAENNDPGIFRRYNFMLKGLGLKESGFEKNKFLHAFGKVLKAMQYGAAVFEYNTKITGYQILKKKIKNGEAAGFYVRNYVGTPNFAEKGMSTRAMNDVFIFSNVIIQGLRADAQLAVKPATRGAYWLTHGITTLLPSSIMAGAMYGMFGDEIKKMYAGIPEYMKTNYYCVPLGLSSEGKTLYWTLPMDDVSRLIHSMTVKGTEMYHGDVRQPSQIAQLPMSMFPGETPPLKIVGNWLQFVSGQNPQDNLYGRPVISDKNFAAGGWYAFKDMMKWTINNSGVKIPIYDPTHESHNEFIVNSIPLFRRAIRESDAGIKERMDAVGAEVNSMRNRELIKQDDLIRQEVAHAKSQNASVDDLDSYNQELKTNYFGDQELTKEQESDQKKMEAKLRLYMIKGVQSSISSAVKGVIDASSKEQQIAKLKDYRKYVGEEEYAQLMDYLTEQKLIGPDVTNALEEE